MIRKEKYSINDILNRRVPEKNKGRANLDGDLIKLGSSNLSLYREKGVQCVECGLKGSYFVKEKNDKDSNFHLNLYAIDNNGEEVLMTKDHIIPKSLNGEDNLENFQVMCTNCNRIKGNKL